MRRDNDEALSALRARFEVLTPRERAILLRVVEGRLNKQIAGELGISIKTVEKHRQQVMNKLNIHDVAGLTRYAISKGVVERELASPLIAPTAVMA